MQVFAEATGGMVELRSAGAAAGAQRQSRSELLDTFAGEEDYPNFRTTGGIANLYVLGFIDDTGGFPN